VRLGWSSVRAAGCSPDTTPVSMLWPTLCLLQQNIKIAGLSYELLLMYYHIGTPRSGADQK